MVAAATAAAVPAAIIKITIDKHKMQYYNRIVSLIHG